MSFTEAHSQRRILIVGATVEIHNDIRQILCPKQSAASHNEVEQESFGTLAKPTANQEGKFHIDSAYQGKDGLNMVKQAKAASAGYALAFVDVGMPPGWDVIETVHQLWAAQPDLQIVLCTTYSDHSGEKIMSRLGSSDNYVILRKPFENIELLQLANALTRKWLLAEQAQMRMSELDAMVAQQTAKLSASNERLQAEIRRREQTEIKLRGSEHRFQLAFKASGVPMAIMHTPTHTYLEVNEGFLSLLGRERDKILGKTPKDLGILPHPEDCDTAMNTMRSKGSVRNHPCRILAKGGTTHDTLISLEPVVLGEEPCVLVAILDITEKKTLEAQLRQSQKMDAIGQLAAGVAHDFNNLLTIIHGHASLQMNRPNQDEQTSHSLTQIKLASDRAAALTRQLLAFSRQQVMQFQPLCLNDSIDQAQAMLRRLLGETIHLECECEEGLSPVMADAHSIGQVIMNLAVNARDAMPGGGRLTISTQGVQVSPEEAKRHPDARAGEFARLTVSDSGHGMDTQLLSRIFEPFFTTKPPGKGTGLGLSTVYGIVKQHNGWMEVESATGLGTKFHIYIAFTDQRADAVEPSVSTLDIPHTKGHKETILVVEDEPVLREFACSVLESHGYKILQAGDGIEAFQIAHKTAARIDLLLTDMVMPNGVSGQELANRLLSHRKDLKVLFTSGYSQELMDNAKHLLTNHTFLPKPFDVNHLLLSVRRCLSTSSSPKECDAATVEGTA